MKNKRLFVSIVALICLMSLLLCGCKSRNPQSELTDEKTFTIQVVHSDGTVMERQITTQQKYLAHALFDEKILVEESALETGLYTIVDGEEASWEKNGAYWWFYIDGVDAFEGMNATELKDGSVYKVEYKVG